MSSSVRTFRLAVMDRGASLVHVVTWKRFNSDDGLSVFVTNVSLSTATVS